MIKEVDFMDKYERTELIITEFDVEDVITTSSYKSQEYENIIIDNP